MTSRGRKSEHPGLDDFELHPETNYVLRLYVAGTTPRSTRSIVNINNFCRRFLGGHYELEVVDIYQQPRAAREQQIIAAPTLVKSSPLPLRRIVGDFSDQQRVADGLDMVSFNE